MVLKSRRLKLHIAASKLHKWLALVVGVQLLLWFSSGLVMSVLPIKQVRGEHLIDRKQTVPLPVGQSFAAPDRLIAAAGGSVHSLSWRMLMGRPVAEVETKDGSIRLFDGVTATALPPVNAAFADEIVRAAWHGPVAHIMATERVTAESTEYRGALPAWRVSFDDSEHTRAYVAATTGEITAVRTGTWRLYDFFWGLHIMDWKNHEDFNTPWLMAFAGGALLLSLAGSVLLAMRWPFRRAKPKIRQSEGNPA